MSQRLRTLGLPGIFFALPACQLVLGFEDHTLAPPDASAPVLDAETDAGDLGGAAAFDAARDDGSSAGGTGTASGGAPTASGGATSAGGTTTRGGAGPGGALSSGGAEATGGVGAEQDAGCALCAVRAGLVHRYRFEGSGTIAVDSTGSSNGTVVNAQLNGSGEVTLRGQQTDEYVDLPNGMVSSLTDATFEAWITWNGGAVWQRIFDFGDSNALGEGVQQMGRTYLFLTPLALGPTGTARVGYKGSAASAEMSVSASRSVRTGTLTHVAVVVNATDDSLRLYLDGRIEGTTAPIGSLSRINDVNNWLGRSQFRADPEFAGSIHEFRIYGMALNAEQVRASFDEGPDPEFLEP